MSKSAGNVVAPQDVIKQSGAEILRLWASAQDYREDLRISQEILNHLDRSLSKDSQYLPFSCSAICMISILTAHRVPYEQLPELDRWALLRLGNLIERIKRDYDDFEFHVESFMN